METIQSNPTENAAKALRATTLEGILGIEHKTFEKNWEEFKQIYLDSVPLLLKNLHFFGLTIAERKSDGTCRDIFIEDLIKEDPSPEDPF